MLKSDWSTDDLVSIRAALFVLIQLVRKDLCGEGDGNIIHLVHFYKAASQKYINLGQ